MDSPNHYTKDMVRKLLCRNIVNLSVDKYGPLYNANFDGEAISQIISDIRKEDQCFASDELVKKHGAIFSPFYLCKIVEWVNNNYCNPNLLVATNFNAKHKERVGRMLTIGSLVFDQNMLSFVRNQLLPFVEDFENCIQRYEKTNNNSKDLFNLELAKLGLENDKSLIYMIDQQYEESVSCRDILCTFAPTFPFGKYESREKFLQPGHVLTFVEAPGTGKYINNISNNNKYKGKSHFAFHLTTSDRLVIPLCGKHIQYLYSKLLQTEKDRLLYNQLTQRFIYFYQSIACFLVNYAAIYTDNISTSSEQIKQYVLRFLWNVGGQWIGEQYFERYNNILPNNTFSNTVWVLDEVHTLQSYGITVPRQTTISEDGNLISLLVSCLRKRGSVVLTTTFFSSVDGNIEKAISKDASKFGHELFSFQLELLPLLTPKQVIDFLNLFITTKNDVLWNYVGFVLQGTIRSTEAFLQQLFWNTKNTNLTHNAQNNNLITLVHKSLYSFFSDKTRIQFDCIRSKLNEPFHKQIFYQLALDGELRLTDYSQHSLDPVWDEITKFLVCAGISFSQPTSNRLKLISCVEKSRMLEYLFTQNNWFDDCYNTLVEKDTKCISLLAEVFVINFLQHNFDLLKMLVPNTYVNNFSLHSKYFFEDSETSKDDVKISTLMLQCIADNIPHIDCVISEFICRPVEHEGIDLLAMLRCNNIENNSFLNFIPLSVSITRLSSGFNDTIMQFLEPITHNKIVTDFTTSDMHNMYLENISGQETASNNYSKIERQKIEQSLTKLKQGNGMQVRLLVHPNQNYSQSTLCQRVASGLYTNSSVVTVKRELSPCSVILQDNSCLIEICDGIQNIYPEWEVFMNEWKKYFGSKHQLL